MALAGMQACNNCSYTGEDLWVISGECEHRNCTKCVADNVQKCGTCRRAKVVKCLYRSSGCSALFKRQFEDQLNRHLKTCDYRKVPCPLYCSERLNKKDLVYHVSDLCPKRLVPCSHCDENFFAEEMKCHFASCGYAPLKCEFCQDETLRMDMDVHLKECPFAVWQCEFSTLGCDFKGTTEDFQKHLTLRSHAKLFVARERKSEEKMNMLSQQVNRLLQEAELLKGYHKTSEERFQASEEKQIYLEEDIKALKAEVTTGKRNAEILKEEIRELNEKLKDSVIDQKSVQELNEAVRSKSEDSMEDLSNLLRRLDAIEENNERDRKRLFSFSDSLRTELLPGLRTKKASTDSLDAVLSCFKVFKGWAEDMTLLQKIIMSREDIDLFSYHSRWFSLLPMTPIGQINSSAVFNLGLQQFAIISYTYVLDQSGNITTTEINAPYESVELVVRFRFLMHKDTTDVFAEVSHSTVSKVQIKLGKFPECNAILETTLTNLQKRVNKVPIFCGCIRTSELSFNFGNHCYFRLDVS